MQETRRRISWWPVTLFAVAALTLVPAALIAQVTVSVEVTGDAVPGGTVTAKATVDITDGSTITSYSWMQMSGVPAIIDGAATDTATVTLGSKAAFKEHLFEVLTEPPISEEDLPPNVPLPEGEFPGGLQNRFEVVGLNPFTLEEAGLVALKVTVNTTSGSYSAMANIHAHLYEWTTGLLNVPIGVPVLLHGKDQESYDWTMTKPAGSGAALMEATTQNPEFVPDVPGLYEVQVTDEAADAAVQLPIYAGTWRGVVVDQNAEGRPIADGACTGCHSGFAPDLFTPWMETGHAEIFTNNLNTNDHYGEGCFSCHSVGYLPGVDNGGFDDAPDYADFLASDLIHDTGPDQWTMMLDQFPDSAQLANIQCENCHGPQSSSNAHAPSGPIGDPRISLSANVCAFCHGEPLRHARYQQWQLSGHANYELAIDEGDSGSCSRCHTANGFLTWLPVLLDDDPDTDPLADIEVTWESDDVHPQTCQTCHDPHAIGTTSGSSPNATVRISGDTPPLIAGFTATDVGRGAICMTCHNTRRGLFNDSVWAQIVAAGDQSRAPHPGAQTDVVMGQNAFFVPIGNRSQHSITDNVQDVCVTCHMEATPPPPDLSYNLGGTNHTFFASPTICGECHEFGDGSIVQDGVEAKLETLGDLLAETYLELFKDKLRAGYTVAFGSDFTATAPADVQAVTGFADSRGRQALLMRFAGGVEGGPYSLSSIQLTPPGGVATPLDKVANSNLLKAGWNYALIESDESKGVHNPSFVNAVLDASIANADAEAPLCEPSGTTLCLGENGRFKVEIMYDDPNDTAGPLPGTAIPFSDTAGVFWFFREDNAEMLIKVLDACNLAGFNSYWVFYSATTQVAFDVTVTDNAADAVKVYSNPAGTTALPVADFAAFACP